MTKKLLCFLALFFASCGVTFAQGIRVPIFVEQQGTIAGVTNAVILTPNPVVNFCGAPANGVPCTNKVTTYTDSTLMTPCPTSAQIVIDGTNSCVNHLDAQNNGGVWVPEGQYTYSVSYSGGNFGPYFVTAGGTGGGGSGCDLSMVTTLKQLYNNAGTCAGEDWTYFAAGDPMDPEGGDILGPDSLGPGMPALHKIASTMDPVYYQVNGQFSGCEDCWKSTLTYDRLKIEYDNPDTMNGGSYIDIFAPEPSIKVALGIDGTEIIYGSSDILAEDRAGNFALALIAADPISNLSAEIQLFGQDESMNYVGIQAPAMIPSSIDYTLTATLPPMDTGYFLSSDTMGNMTWQAAGGGGGTIGGSITAGQVAFGAITSDSIEGSANATLDTSGNLFTAGTLTVGALAGSGARCVHVDASGLQSPTSGDCGTGGSGSVTSISTTSPITGGTITTTGTIACATCTTNAAALTANHLMVGAGSQAAAIVASLGTTTTVYHGNAAGVGTFGAVNLAADVSGQLPIAAVGSAGLSGTSPISIASSGVISCSTCSTTSGTVTSVATTAPLGGGTITATGTLTCSTCVTSTSPGAGIAHFAGSTQNVTSSAVNLAGGDVTGKLPIGSVGSAGLSGTAPISVASTGVISCTGGCVTGSAVNHAIAIGTSATNIVGGPTPPTVNGSYWCGYMVTGSAAVDPTCPIAGLTAISLNGSASTDTVTYAYNETTVLHDVAGSASITETLPTPTTLGNANFTFRYVNHSSHTDTISATTFNIQSGTSMAASTLSVPSGTSCQIYRDEFNANTWSADCVLLQ